MEKIQIMSISNDTYIYIHIFHCSYSFSVKKFQSTFESKRINKILHHFKPPITPSLSILICNVSSLSPYTVSLHSNDIFVYLYLASKVIQNRIEVQKNEQDLTPSQTTIIPSLFILIYDGFSLPP